MFPQGSSRRLACTLALVFVTACSSTQSTSGTANAKAKLPEDRDPAVLLERGKAFAAQGDLVRAEQYLAAALSAGADERAVVPLLVRVCVASKHYRLASEYAGQMLARNPNDSRLRLLVGALYVSTGSPARAREHLERAARELSEDGEVQFTVAVFFRDEVADRAMADKYFREYLRLQKNGAHADEARASLMERIE